MTASAPRAPAVAFHKRLYVWSCLLEPLYIFVIFEESAFGITGNVSRILQLLACAVLGWRLLLYVVNPHRKPLTVPDPRAPLYRYYAAMFALSVVAGIIGYFRGAYELPSAYYALGVRSSFSRILNSPSVRPLFEYIASLYYFCYFVVLPQYLLTTEAEIDYALSRFKRLFVLSFVIGIAGLASSIWWIDWLPRHLSDWSKVGPQFHGLAGEPRQAFVYLFLGLAMLHLIAFLDGRKLSRRWVVAVVVAAALTQSTTGLVAIALFIGLYAAYASLGLSMRRIPQLIGGLLLVLALAYVAAVSSSRTMDYFRSASNLWNVLETGQELPFLMTKSNSDIYPMYDLTVKARAGDLLPVMIGSGLGSASAVANRYYRETAELNNPHSQLARSLFETGLIGTFLYAMIFVGPVRTMTRRLPTKTQRDFMLLTLLLLGCGLADRSAAPFLYLGLFAAAFRVRRIGTAGAAGPESVPAAVSA